MAGRKRTPTSIKEAKGTQRKSRRNPAEPQVIPEEPILDWQTDDPEVVAWYERFKGYLRGENRLSKSHETILWLAARRAWEIQLLDLEIFDNGRTYVAENRHGEVLKSNPAVGQKNEAERHLHSLLSELGLTPASKSKVSSDISKRSSNEWAGFGGAGA
jgi:P27 family predicted phage terminase small subunit